MDDDIIPGQRCFERYLSEAARLNGIIGGNGRIAERNVFKPKLTHPPDIGLRSETTLVDFVGHVWVFNSQNLRDMFSVPATTLDTGEDMHLCFSAKLRSGTSSYVCMQVDPDERCDSSANALSSDQYSSFNYTAPESRVRVEEYFESLGLSFIVEN